MLARLAAYVGEIAHDWVPEPFSVRLNAISKDVSSLTDYETHLSDKVQFLLDATLGYISIEQNDLFKVLTIVSVIGVPPTLARRHLGHELQEHARAGLGLGISFGVARHHSERGFATHLVQKARMVLELVACLKELSPCPQFNAMLEYPS